MDPDRALAQCREAAGKLLNMVDGMGDGAPDPIHLAYMIDEVESLVESFTALDAWVTQGGFLPGAWGKW